MALTVEDGTGLADADAYVSLAFARQYCEDYGLVDGTNATDGAFEVAIRQATEYMDAVYQPTAASLTTTQALSWPTEDSDGVPIRLQFGCTRLAVFALSNELAPVTTQAGVVSERKRLGDLEKETTYETPSVNLPVFSYVNAMMRGLYSYTSLSGNSAGVFR